MNESSPEDTSIPAAPSPDFKDRSAGLTIFGVLTILLGCAAGLIALLMLAVTIFRPPNANVPPPSFSSIVYVVSLYGGLAVVLIWLGIGSFMARRWARALLLIFSVSWLVIGMVTTIGMVFFLPKTFANLPATPGQAALPPGAIAGMVVGVTLFLGFFFVLLPAVWTFFYASRHVKTTCEMRDPVTRWTDACPLPVLALCLWLWFAVPFTLLMPVLYHGVIPFFGMLLSGLPGSLYCLLVAALYAYCAWRLYKLDVCGWWLTLIAMLLYAVSGLITFARHDMAEMYQLMGYPQAQIDQIQKMGMFTGNSMIWMMLFCTVPFLGYILFVKKYFPAKT